MTRFREPATASATAAPNSTIARRSSARDGATSTTGSALFCCSGAANTSLAPVRWSARPRNTNGTAAPQSSTATLPSRRLPPQLVTATGKPRRRACSAIASLRSQSIGTRSSTERPFQRNAPSAAAAPATANAPSTRMPCGVATTSVSGRAASQRRCSSSIAARVASAPSASSESALSSARPCGAIQRQTIPVMPPSIP